MSRVLVGLDYGRKRIGIAVSTPLGTVHPRPRLERTTLDRDLVALKALAEEAGADGFVIGLPHNMDGTRSEIEGEARAFAAALAEVAGLPVHGADERLTTEAAASALRHGEVFGRAQRERKDSAAACIVLADYLHGGEEGERIA